jgi:hypothetical protein
VQGVLGSSPKGQGALGSSPKGQRALGSSPKGQGALGSSPKGQRALGSSPKGQRALGSSLKGQGALGSMLKKMLKKIEKNRPCWSRWDSNPVSENPKFIYHRHRRYTHAHIEHVTNLGCYQLPNESQVHSHTGIFP